MKNAAVKLWHWGRWPLLVVVVGFVALVAWRLKLLYEADDTNAAVAAIHANKLTHDDVFGDLPPEPDKAQNDATLAGIDANNNGIRDDVERAIYFKYKESATQAAPAFQYAKALQMEFTKVYNSPTLVAVTQEEARAVFCIGLLSKVSATDSPGTIKEKLHISGERQKEIENLVFNSTSRIEAWKKNDEFTRSYTLLGEPYCDIDPSTLSN